MKFHMLLVTYSEYMYPGGGKKKKKANKNFICILQPPNHTANNLIVIRGCLV